MATDRTTRYYASGLTRIYTPTRGDKPKLPTLDQVSVTETRSFDTFADFSAFVLNDMRYPKPQSQKYECYGWTASTFSPSDYVKTRRRDGGTWTKHCRERNGASESTHQCAWVGDVDNDRDASKILDHEQFVTNLRKHGIDVAWFSYHSYSSTPDKPKFRIVMDTSREFTRTESASLFVWINNRILNGQGDRSIYDPGDYLYGPPFNAVMDGDGGGRLDVDAILAEVAVDPWMAKLAAEMIKPTHVAGRDLTPEERAQIAAQLAEETPKDDVSIDNHKYFNPAWKDDYANGGSHWEAMRSLLGRIWLKSGGTLNLGDFLLLAEEIDALDAGYFARKYGYAALVDRVRWTMERHVSPPTPATPSIQTFNEIMARRDRKSLAGFTPKTKTI